MIKIDSTQGLCITLSKKNLVTFSHYYFSFFHFNSLQKTVQLGLSGSSTTSLQHVIYICTTHSGHCCGLGGQPAVTVFAQPQQQDLRLLITILSRLFIAALKSCPIQRPARLSAPLRCKFATTLVSLRASSQLKKGAVHK